MRLSKNNIYLWKYAAYELIYVGIGISYFCTGEWAVKPDNESFGKN